VDVGAAAERLDETRVGGEMGDAAELDLVVVGDEQLEPRGGDERLAELTPVRATVWLNVAWMRPSGATSAIRPVPYVPRSFSISRYCISGSMNSGHSSRKRSNVAASVEYPVLVFFCGANCFSV
jgi:hypothetical protein